MGDAFGSANSAAVANDLNKSSQSVGQALPVPNPGLSYWQRTTRAFPLLNVNRDTPVPATSKYVVIGSGISGALTAFELLENGVKGEDVIILEAREAASGASSRNAGHVRPDAFRGFTAYSNVHGTEQALKIIANERLVLQKVDDFVRKHNAPVDVHISTTFDVCLTPEFAAYEARSYEAYKAAGGDISEIKYYEGEQAKTKTGVPSAVTAYEWPAGSSHPAKLAHFLLNAAATKGVTLFTHCPATSINKVSDSPSAAPLWSIKTPRGSVTASTIIHCTNAHAALLLPNLSPHLTPNRAQAHSLIAPPSFSGSSIRSSTYSLRYSLHHFYSLIQRQGDGTLILGVSRSNPTLSTETLSQTVSIDDSSYNQEILEDAVEHFQRIFPEYKDKERAQIHGEGLDHAWNGVIAMTSDSVPYVGAIEEMPGQYICAGFNGHGMARIFTCAPGVARLATGGNWADTGLPECFQITQDRLKSIADGHHQSVW
ncbi:MAG: hypothetical protein M1818_002025 [Claussenomyces sp. TS43310]|nr:MAG: hypothetical protein M1818_002025 [Claussenomyces sp. TS43310]